MQVGSIINFSLMYLLAPTAAVAGSSAGQSLVAKFFSENTLKAMGAPGGNMFEPGAFTLLNRLTNFAYKVCICFSVYLPI